MVTNDPENFYYYSNESVRIISDLIPGRTAFGIHAGLYCARYDVTRRYHDMPFLNMDLAAI